MIRYVFDTHYHWDHTQGNSVMTDQGVTVVCSQGCASELAVLTKEGILFTGDLCVNWRSGNNVGDRDADPQRRVQVLN